MNDGILTIGEAAKILDLSTQRVRQLERSGILPSQRTTTGMRLFHACLVEQLRKQRKERKAK